MTPTPLGRIAVFLPGLYGGGAERTMLTLTEGLAARGFPVDLVLAQSEGPLMSEIPSRVRLVELDARRTVTSVRGLVRYLRRERPTALLSSLSRANFVAIAARRIAGLPSRLVVNEQNTVSVLTKNSRDWRERLVPALARRLYPSASVVTAVSQGVADDLVDHVSLPRQLVRVIYNPGITPEMEAKAREPVEHAWFEAGQPPVLVAVGSLTPQKDFPNLLRAFARVRANRPVRLLILGEGRLRGELQALVRELALENDVQMPGFVANPIAFVARAAAFVLSSRWEGLPTVLVEALYTGVPLVATDCPSGPREILKGGELGVLVPVEDPEALAAGIVRALDGAAPRATAESWLPYTREAVVEEYLKVLAPEGRQER